MNQIFSYFIFTYLFITLFYSVQCDILLDGKKVDSPSWKYGVTDHAPITGKIVKVDPFFACSKHFKNAADLNGTIAFVLRGGGCEFAEKVRNAQHFGVLSVIILDLGNEPNYISALYKNTGKKDITIPAFIVQGKGGKTIKSAVHKSDNVTVTLVATRSVWLDWVQGRTWRVSLAFMVFCLCMIFIWAGTKLVFLIYQNGFRPLEISQLVLMTEMMGSFWMCMAAPDFVYWRGLFSYQVQVWMNSLGLPFFTMATLLMAFYWLQITRTMSKSLTLNKKKFFIPFVIVMSAVFILYLTTTVLATTYTDTGVGLALAGGVWVLIQFFASIFYAVSVSILLYRLSRGKSNQSKGGQIRRMGMKLLASSIGRIAFMIGCFLWTSAIYGTGPLMTNIIWMIIVFGFCITSYGEIWVFNVHYRGKKGKTAKSVEENASNRTSFMTKDRFERTSQSQTVDESKTVETRQSDNSGTSASLESKDIEMKHADTPSDNSGTSTSAVDPQTPANLDV